MHPRMLRKWSPMVVVSTCSFLAAPAAFGQTPQALVLPACPLTEPGAGVGAKAAPLIGLLVHTVITKGLDMVGTALNEAAKDKITRVELPASPPRPYYTMGSDSSLSTSTDIGCVVLFVPGSAPDVQTPWRATVEQAFMQQKVQTPVRFAPDLYAEFLVRRLSETNGLTLQPQLLYLRKPLLDGGWSWTRRDPKGYAVTLSLTDEGTGQAFGAANFAFPNVEAGTTWVARDGLQADAKALPNWPVQMAVPALPVGDTIKQAQAAQKSRNAVRVEANGILRKAVTPPVERGLIEEEGIYLKAVEDLCTQIASATVQPPGRAASATQAPPGPSDPRCPYAVWRKRIVADQAAKAASRAVDNAWATKVLGSCDRTVENAGKPHEYQRCQLLAPDEPELGRFTLRAAVVETAEATQFVKTLASAFEQNKETLGTQLNDRLNPVRREQLAAAESAAERDAHQKLQLALLRVKEAQAAYDEAAGDKPSARIAAEILLTQAKIDANAAARLAGSASLYPELD